MTNCKTYFKALKHHNFQRIPSSPWTNKSGLLKKLVRLQTYNNPFGLAEGEVSGLAQLC